MAERMCSVAGCDVKSRRRGWCGKHYMRWYRTGTVELATPRTDANAFAERVTRDPSGCLLWTRSLDRDGYGRFWLPNGAVRAHRWSYEHHVGPIPEGLELDHLCRVRRCVEPTHLEPVTKAENRARSPIVSEHLTECKYGHPFDEANTYRTPAGHRVCRECYRRSRRKYLARQAS